MGRSSCGGEIGAFHCNQWGLCCIVVWKCMNQLSCHIVSGVVPDIDVLDGVHMPQGNFRHLHPIHLNGQNEVRLLHSSLQNRPTSRRL